MSTYIKGMGCCDETQACIDSLLCGTGCGGTGAPCVGALPVIVSSGSASGTVGVAFSYFIIATNSPTSYGVTGTLPAGLSLNTGTGEISGTPSGAEVRTVTISATNACGTGTKSLTITIVACGTTPVITSGLTASGRETVVFAGYTITATNTPTSFNASPLPTGLAVNTSTGDITGTPAVGQNGVHYITISATNACGTGYAVLELTIADCVSPGEPTLVAEQVGAQGAKCGFIEYFPDGIDDHYYLTKSFGGTMDFRAYSASPCTGTENPVGSITYSGRAKFIWDNWASFENGVEVDSGAGCPFDGDTANAKGAWTFNDSGTCSASGELLMEFGGAVSDVYPPNVGCSDTPWNFPSPDTYNFIYTSSTTAGIYTTGCQGTLGLFVGPLVQTLSDEYTTAQLISDVQSSMPSFSGNFTGAALAEKTLGSGDTHYGEYTFQYKFILPDLTGYSAYGISWNEFNVTTLSFTSKTYSGVAGETPVQTLSEIPGINEVVTITDIEVTGWTCT
jgi:hypothetical protein